MIRLPATILLATLLTASPSLGAASDELAVVADTVDALMSPRQSDRPRQHLPRLEFSLQATFACADSDAAATVTVSIADTHKRFRPAADERSLTALINVPRRQIAPVTTGDFCLSDTAGGDRFLTLAGIASAQVSLRCRSEARVSVRYESVPLAVRLECAPDVDQESPDASAPAAR